MLLFVVAASFVDFLDEMFESCDVIVGEEEEHAGEGKRLSMGRLTALIQQLEVLHSQQQLSKLPLETITRMLTLLDEHVKLGVSVDLNDGDQVRCLPCTGKLRRKAGHFTFT